MKNIFRVYNTLLHMRYFSIFYISQFETHPDSKQN